MADQGPEGGTATDHGAEEDSLSGQAGTPSGVEVQVVSVHRAPKVCSSVTSNLEREKPG